MLAISAVGEDGDETLVSGRVTRYMCSAIVVSGACGNVVLMLKGAPIDIRRRRREGIKVSLLG